MRRGQGSLEYLMIFAAILAIAVVVVLTANYLVGAPTEASGVQQDKLNFAISGFEIRGYDSPFDPSDNSTLPNSIVKDGVDYFYTDEKPDDAEFIGWLTDMDGNQYDVYIGGGDGDSSGNYYVESGGVCGDGNQNVGEECDPPVDVCLPPYEGNCTYCDADCNNVTLEGGYCGDGNTNVPDEECDGVDLNGATCESLGYVGGELGCDGCVFNTENCIECNIDSDCDPNHACIDNYCHEILTGCSSSMTESGKRYTIASNMYGCAFGVTVHSGVTDSVLNCEDKVIAGNVVPGPHYTGTCISIGQNARNITIENCRISSCYTPINIGFVGSDNITIRNCEITGSDIASVYTRANNGRLENTTIKNSLNYAFNYGSGITGWDFINNTITSSNARGIRVPNGATHWFEENTICASGYDIRCEGGGWPDGTPTNIYDTSEVCTVPKGGSCS